MQSNTGSEEHLETPILQYAGGVIAAKLDRTEKELVHGVSFHTLFTLEDNYGLKVSELDGEVCLKVDVRKNKDAAQLHEMLCSWQQAAAMLEAGEISKEDYDKWRYHYPEFDKAQNYVKVPPQDLF